MQSSIEVKVLLEEDLDLLVELVKENELYLSEEWPGIGTRYRNPKIKLQLRGVLESVDSNIWGVFIHSSLVGAVHVGYRELNSLEVGYFVSKQWSNQGVATAALQMFADKVSLEPCTIRATVNIDNVPSIKVVEKAGFTVIKRTSTKLIYCKAGS